MNGTAEPWDYPSDNACTGETSDLFSAMGYSIHTDRWRYTLWLQWDGAKRDKVSWDAVHGEELYDHEVRMPTDLTVFACGGGIDHPVFLRRVMMGLTRTSAPPRKRIVHICGCG